MFRYRLTPRANPQAVSIGGSSTQSTAVASTTKCVRLVSTVDCYVAFGANPTATSSSLYLVAKVPEVFGVEPSDKVAVLQVGSGGSLSVTEGSAI